MRIVSIANRHSRLRFPRGAVERAIRLLDLHFAAGARPGARRKKPSSAPPGELSLVFLTDPALARLHADFLDDPSPTDVITFEGDPALGLAGEICVSADAAARQAGRPRAGNSPAFSAELTLYLVHGWLHLAGYDDLAPAKKRIMRRAERRAMKLLRTHAAIPRFRLAPSR